MHGYSSRPSSYPEFQRESLLLRRGNWNKKLWREKVQIETKDMKKTEIENLEILRISGNVSSILKN